MSVASRRAVIVGIMASGAVGIAAQAVKADDPLRALLPPAGAALLVRDGEARDVVVTVGTADATGAPITAQTNFRLASLTKSFTAFAVLQLVGQRFLRLETRLGELFVECPMQFASVQVRHLLTHSAGLREYDELADTSTAQLGDLDVLRLAFASGGPAFEPGSRFAYSNTGYAILAMVIERVTGRRFDAVVHDSIFVPLQMDASTAYVPGFGSVRRRAYGHRVGEGTRTLADQSRFSAVLGDGGVYSSLNDLARWDDALRQGALLPAALHRLMYQVAPVSRRQIDDGHSYGLGWCLSDVSGERWAYHNGKTIGFRSMMARSLDRRRSVVLLVNQEPLDVFPVMGSIWRTLGWNSAIWDQVKDKP
jgi:CubicO group peptidase (beta-lactamase class C family)